MNVFLVGWRAAGHLDDAPARTALARLRPHLTFAATAREAAWRSPSGSSVAFCLAHSSSALGGIEPWRMEPDRMALFCGRPILWDGDTADGISAIDAGRYLESAATWEDALDGRFAIVRVRSGAGGDEVLVHPDPLGSYPIYTRGTSGERWVSNNAALLAMVGAPPALDRLSVAGLAGCGWSLGGGSAWEGVGRLPRGTSLTLSRDGARERDVLPTSELAAMLGGRWDPDAASTILAASVEAAAQWPGRPTTLSLTGGRDSRVVLAAAVHASARVLPETGTEPDIREEPLDVTIARSLCELVGMPHQLNSWTPVTPDAYRSAIRAHPYLSQGVVSMGDVLVLAQTEALKVRMTGHGGELARFTHFHPRALGRRTVEPVRPVTAEAAAASLLRNTVKLVPRPILSREGRELVRGYVRRWARERAGLGLSALDLGTLFYLEERMTNWAAPLQTMYEYAGDTFAPLWTRRLLPHQLGCPPQSRLTNAFAETMVRRLAPVLADVPYESDLARRSLAGRGRRFVAGRLAQRRPAPPVPASSPRDGIGEAVAEQRAIVLDAPRDHAAWDVLDRDRVRALLSRDPSTLDARTRHHFWRAITVFSSTTLTADGTPPTGTARAAGHPGGSPA